MKIGDQVEVLYNGEWTPGKITAVKTPQYQDQGGARHPERGKSGKPLEICTVDTGKAMVAGVAVDYGTLRLPQLAQDAPEKGA